MEIRRWRDTANLTIKTMKLFLNLEDNTIRSTIGATAPLRALNRRRGTRESIQIVTYRNLSPEALAPEAELVVVVKKLNDFSGSALTDTRLWDRTGAEWTGRLLFDTSPINTALADDPFLECALEVSYKQSDDDITAPAISLQIFNDYEKGDELHVDDTSSTVATPKMLLDVSAVPSSANDFSMFADSVAPSGGVFMVPTPNGLWVLVAGWTEWRFITSSIPE